MGTPVTVKTLTIALIEYAFKNNGATASNISYLKDFYDAYTNKTKIVPKKKCNCGGSSNKVIDNGRDVHNKFVNVANSIINSNLTDQAKVKAVFNTDKLR